MRPFDTMVMTLIGCIAAAGAINAGYRLVTGDGLFIGSSHAAHRRAQSPAADGEPRLGNQSDDARIVLESARPSTGYSRRSDADNPVDTEPRIPSEAELEKLSNPEQE
jgi:hypothetical protein